MAGPNGPEPPCDFDGAAAIGRPAKAGIPPLEISAGRSDPSTGREQLVPSGSDTCGVFLRCHNRCDHEQDRFDIVISSVHFECESSHRDQWAE